MLGESDPHQNTTNPYTGNETYDTLVITMLSLRIGVMFVIFFLNSIQTVLEYQHLKAHRKPISPRFMTFLSISLFPLCRSIEPFFYLFIVPRRGVGSASWYLSTLGTFFIFTEWIFIGAFWTQLLYTFFVSNAIILKNSKRAWHVAWGFSITIFIWYVIMWSLSKSSVDINRASSLGNLAFIVLYGFIVFINGVVLIKLMRGQVEKIPRLQATITKTVKLASVLIILVILSTISSLIFNFLLHLDSYSNYRFISTFIVGFAEFLQVIVVMAALGGDSPRNYFMFKRVNDTSSHPSTGISNGGGGFRDGTMKDGSGGGGRGGYTSGPSLSNTQSGFINREISLSSISVSSSPQVGHREMNNVMIVSTTPPTIALSISPPTSPFNNSYIGDMEDNANINNSSSIGIIITPQEDGGGGPQDHQQIDSSHPHTSGGVSSFDLLSQDT